MKRHLLILSSLLVGVCGAAGQTNIAPRADQVLRAACRFLAEAPYFGLTSEVWREHVNEAGEKLQFTQLVELQLKRPNRLHVEIRSAHSDRGFWYSGKDLSILDRKRNLFSSAAMPATVDGMLDAAHDQFGIDLPMIDFALSDPYKNAIARVQSGRYLGLATALGYTCHHLAFTQPDIDWQVWIEEGPQPLIRKFVINHKQEPGSPEFTGLIRGWDLLGRISDSDFVFQPPRGALKVQMRKDESFTGPGNEHSAAAGAPTGR